MSMVHRPGVLSVALTVLRRRRGLHRYELAQRCRFSEAYLRLLESKVEPSWEILLELAVEVMKYDIEEVESTVYGLTRGTEPLRIPESPIPITDEEARAIRRAAGPLGRAVTDAREELSIRELRAEKVRQARKDAEELCKTLLRSKGRMRQLYLESSTYQTFAVAERLCELSTKAARQSARLVLEIARLAYRVAALMPGDERWRARVRGFCLAFVANAWRVLGQLKKADILFRYALELWDQGWDPDHIFPEWRLPDLLASLRRDQRRFPEALDLHERAKAAAPRASWGRILLNKASTLDQMFEAEEALRVLREAALLIDEAKDPNPWLREGLGYLTCVNLCHLGRFGEAGKWLRVAWPFDSRNEKDLIKVRWLSGRVAAGLGQIASALESFKIVRQYFEHEPNAYSYALASLEEASLHLDLGHCAQVQEMVIRDMAWVFRDAGIHREAMAALELFREAVEGKKATGEFARRVNHYLVRAEKNRDLRFKA